MSARNGSTLKFPEHFLWGTATSPTQIEGSIQNEWTDFVARDGGTCRVACDSYTKRAANPVIASDCRLIPEQWLSYSPGLISLALSLALASSGFAIPLQISKSEMAEGVGFEPTVALRLLLISSQMPLTTQPPFLSLIFTG